jgi:hypothetical protein
MVLPAEAENTEQSNGDLIPKEIAMAAAKKQKKH